MWTLSLFQEEGSRLLEKTSGASPVVVIPNNNTVTNNNKRRASSIVRLNSTVSSGPNSHAEATITLLTSASGVRQFYREMDHFNFNLTRVLMRVH